MSNIRQTLVFTERPEDVTSEMIAVEAIRAANADAQRHMHVTKLVEKRWDEKNGVTVVVVDILADGD